MRAQYTTPFNAYDNRRKTASHLLYLAFEGRWRWDHIRLNVLSILVVSIRASRLTVTWSFKTNLKLQLTDEDIDFDIYLSVVIKSACDN